MRRSSNLYISQTLIITSERDLRENIGPARRPINLPLSYNLGLFILLYFTNTARLGFINYQFHVNVSQKSRKTNIISGNRQGILLLLKHDFWRCPGKTTQGTCGKLRGS